MFPGTFAFAADVLHPILYAYKYKLYKVLRHIIHPLNPLIYGFSEMSIIGLLGEYIISEYLFYITYISIPLEIVWIEK